nr:MAG TPA: hypothetical protein [Caudoviricetes sp.]
MTFVLSNGIMKGLVLTSIGDLAIMEDDKVESL